MSPLRHSRAARLDDGIESFPIRSGILLALMASIAMILPIQAGGVDESWVPERFSISEETPSPDMHFVAYELTSKRGDYIRIVDQKTKVASEIHSPDTEVLKKYWKSTHGIESDFAGRRRTLYDFAWLKVNRVKVAYGMLVALDDDSPYPKDLVVTRIFENRDGVGFEQVGEPSFELVRALGY